MSTKMYDSNPDTARLSRALDMLLEYLLGLYVSNELEPTEEINAHDVPDEPASGEVPPDGSSSKASKSERFTRLPPPDFNS